MSEHRTNHGESMRAVSRRCALAPADIAQVELGRADLDNEALAAVVQAYAVPRVRFPANYSQVLVNLVSGAVSVRPRNEPVGESSTDSMMLVYLELLYSTKDMPADAEVTFTSLDLDVVRMMLASHTEEVTARLDDLTLPSRPVTRLRRPSSASTFLVGAAAATIALVVSIAIGNARTSVEPSAISAPTAPAAVAVAQPAAAATGGSQVDPRNPAASEPAGVAVPIEVKIIDPLVVTRQPDGGSTSSDSSGNSPVDPSKETK